MLLLGVLQAQAAGLAPAGAGSFDLLETQVLDSAAASVTFSSLSTYAADYQHLQIRMVSRDTRVTSGNNIVVRFNADTASNYSWHHIRGIAGVVSSVGVASQTSMLLTETGSTDTANSFAANVIDILDPFETTKYKTLRALGGQHSSTNADAPRIYFWSGNWRNTNALTSISFAAELGSFVIGSRFSLYGIKAA